MLATLNVSTAPVRALRTNIADVEHILSAIATGQAPDERMQALWRSCRDGLDRRACHWLAGPRFAKAVAVGADQVVRPAHNAGADGNPGRLQVRGSGRGSGLPLAVGRDS